MAEAFSQSTIQQNAGLNGRAPVNFKEVQKIGPVVIKAYLRGGLMGTFNRRTYLRWGKTRCEVEFELLNTVRGLGVPTPEPVAYAHTKGWRYQAWLITKKIENRGTLARYCLKKQDDIPAVMRDIARQVSLLIDHKILHVDLHPGNVIVNGEKRAYLLDFDKGRLFQGSKKRLRQRYLSRWRRAVSKHRLPEQLSKLLEAGVT